MGVAGKCGRKAIDTRMRKVQVSFYLPRWQAERLKAAEEAAGIGLGEALGIEDLEKKIRVVSLILKKTK